VSFSSNEDKLICKTYRRSSIIFGTPSRSPVMVMVPVIPALSHLVAITSEIVKLVRLSAGSYQLVL
jgi:hypothetical protein